MDISDIKDSLKPAYRLASREHHPENSVVTVQNVKFGDGSCPVLAGPCAVESEKQIITTALFVKQQGASMLRGGAFKPRTSPYSFQGLGEEGLKLLAKAGKEAGIPVVTEVLDSSDVDLVAEYADLLQIGSRNMSNSKLLKAAGKSAKPILLKRGMSARLDELLLSAEYILAEGNPNVILAERGIRTQSDFSRNTLDLNIVPALKIATHLPVIVDPSHGTGRPDLVLPMSLASVASGADGLMIETHPDPEKALSDSDQALTFDQFAEAMTKIKSCIEWRLSTIQNNQF